MMTDLRQDITEAFLETLASGEDIQSYLNDYPELRSLLETALQAERLTISSVPADAMNRSRTRVLSHAAQLRADLPSAKGIFTRLPHLAVATFIALFAFLAWSSLLIASARSLPGDQLYSVKRAVENFRLNLISNPDSYHHIEEQYRVRRVEEVHQLLDRQRSEYVSFDGKVSEMGKRHWIIDTIPVIVAPETVILGQIEIGMLVEVEGITQLEGWVRASEIHLQAFEIFGVVEELNNQILIVSGQDISINPNTQMDPQIQIGAQVQVVVQVDDEGTLHAIEILLLNLTPNVTPGSPATPTLLPTQITKSTPIGTSDLDNAESEAEDVDEHESESEDSGGKPNEKDDESSEDEDKEDHDESGNEDDEEDSGREDD